MKTVITTTLLQKAAKFVNILRKTTKTTQMKDEKTVICFEIEHSTNGEIRENHVRYCPQSHDIPNMKTEASAKVNREKTGRENSSKIAVFRPYLMAIS